MSEFTYLFRGREVNASPEQMQKTMEKWVAWFKDLGAKGHIKDPGHPLVMIWFIFSCRISQIRPSTVSGFRRTTTSTWFFWP